MLMNVQTRMADVRTTVSTHLEVTSAHVLMRSCHWLTINILVKVKCSIIKPRELLNANSSKRLCW